MILRNRRTPLRATQAPPTPPRRCRPKALAGLAAAACLAFPLAGTAAAAPAEQARSYGSKLDFTELTQEQDQWCWVATGLSVAQHLGYGKDTDQNTFCNLAHGQDGGSACPNQPGELTDVQNAWSGLGMSPGNVTGVIPFSTVTSSIDANSPVEVGIYWTAGGGHANVLYGYDSASNTMLYADPWPSNPRYGEMDYSTYVSNNQFNWAESLYGEK
ncbi:papain-like cysteine protease family protein [Streptomyces sp. NPDC057743]|uniref:papain-like cysteine protease family protein n=1 Tax=Streptomyces sp. NPDC057743 TaxID=3346236 RepID=UPI0036902666